MDNVISHQVRFADRTGPKTEILDICKACEQMHGLPEHTEYLGELHGLHRGKCVHPFHRKDTLELANNDFEERLSDAMCEHLDYNSAFGIFYWKDYANAVLNELWDGETYADSDGNERYYKIIGSHTKSGCTIIVQSGSLTIEYNVLTIYS